ncbi:MAG: hypothetical protein ABW141_13030 [Candidatus Thiodiazotropha endolucinida]
MIDRPEFFVKLIHPTTLGGYAILRRKENGRHRNSKVPADQLQKIAKSVFGHRLHYISLASFYGNPIFLNFQQTSCLHVALPANKNNISDVLLNSSYALDRQSFPQPNLRVFDGEVLINIWNLKNKLAAQDAYKYLLYENIIHQTLLDYGLSPILESISPSYLCPIVGTYNNKPNHPSRIERYNESPINNTSIDQVIIDCISPKNIEDVTTGISALIDLKILFRERIFEIASNPECRNDWLIYFGATLRERLNKS